MKPIYLLFIVFSLSCSSKTNENDKIVKIEQINSGYNIYSEEGALLLEFTNNNTDSFSLNTLKYIYEVCADYHYDPNHFKIK